MSDLIRSIYPVVLASQADPRTVARLVNSVLRPLAESLPAPAPVPASTDPTASPASQTPDAPPAPDAPGALWDTALLATRLRTRFGRSAPPGLLEATAALQDLAVNEAPAAERAKRLAALADQMGNLPPGIVTAKNGPYLVTNAAAVRNPLGERLHPAPAARAVPVRRLGEQAVLRRNARDQRIHRRQGPQARPRPARHLPGGAGHDLRQPGHLPAFGPVHRPAGHGVPHEGGAVRRA